MTLNRKSKKTSSKKKVEEFIKILLIPNGKDCTELLFYTICYAVPLEETKKKKKKKNLKKCSNERLDPDLPDGLFTSLD